MRDEIAGAFTLCWWHVSDGILESRGNLVSIEQVNWPNTLECTGSFDGCRVLETELVFHEVSKIRTSLAVSSPSKLHN